VSKTHGSKGKPAAKRRNRAALGASRGLDVQPIPAPEGRKERRSNELYTELRIIPVPLAEDIEPGDSLADKLVESLWQRKIAFAPGDILVVKHKIISKAEGRVVDLATMKPSAESISWARKYKLDARVIELALGESRAVIRRKNGVLITETQHGFICANSGVDVSNVDGGGHALLLPADPDRSARRLHLALKKTTNLAIPIIITDSFGRPWREGLADFCIGIAGMKALRDDRGRRDPHGYALHASLEAVADELAAAAGLVCGKLNRTPACIIRGFPYEPHRGRTRDLLRPASTDLFR
jgi:coenzyme F420-0:L-glutamate ligase / coenzyme F420-1:gamma-L-glutamate ligase